jgi:hypothetical protein
MTMFEARIAAFVEALNTGIQVDLRKEGCIAGIENGSCNSKHVQDKLGEPRLAIGRGRAKSSGGGSDHKEKGRDSCVSIASRGIARTRFQQLIVGGIP